MMILVARVGGDDTVALGGLETFLLVVDKQYSIEGGGKIYRDAPILINDLFEANYFFKLYFVLSNISPQPKL